MKLFSSVKNNNTIGVRIAQLAQKIHYSRKLGTYRKKLKPF